MSSAFASRCLQGKFWQLICEALNKRAVTGARLPFQRFLVFPHLRGDWGDSAGERCRASGLFVNASRQVSRMLPSCLKHVLGLCCLKEKVKNSSALTSWGPSDNAPPLRQPAGLPESVILLHFLPPQGFGICSRPACKIVPTAPSQGDAFSPSTCQPSPVSFHHGSSTRSEFALYWFSLPPLLCLTCNLIFVGVIM